MSMSNLRLDQKGRETIESVNLLGSLLGFPARNVNAFSFTMQFSSSKNSQYYCIYQNTFYAQKLTLV